MTAPAPAALPAVSGRHRNKALATARKTRAIELKLQGLTYQQVADELGYANRGTVYRLIRHTQAERLSEVAEEYRRLELERLDALQDVLWPKAMAGDLDATEQVRKLIEARCRLLGFMSSRKRAETACKQPQTVVLQDPDCRLMSCPAHA